FLSVDPLLSLTGEPYSYVDGDPANLTDPLGLVCELGSPTRGSFQRAWSRSLQSVWTTPGAIGLPGGLGGVQGGIDIPRPGMRAAVAGLAAIIADFCAKHPDECLRGGGDTGLILYRAGRYAKSDLNYGPNRELSFWNSLSNKAAWDLKA